MANTTNFGWETPDDTDLVKDGAAAIRTLGSAIDTSMVDLKGGTTGQILSKTSNTDMDFTWVAANPGDITSVGVTSPITGGGSSGDVTIAIQDASTTQKGAVQLEDSTSSTSTTKAATPNSVKSAYDLANGAVAKSLVDAKGDLLVGSADNTIARLAVGTDNYVLTADAAATNGIKWAAASSGGGFTLLNSGGTAASGTAFNISSLSTSYEHLCIVMKDFYMSASNDAVYLRPNNDQTTSPGKYSEQWTKSIGTSVSSGGANSATEVAIMYPINNSSTARFKGNAIIWIYRYNDTDTRIIKIDYYGYNGSSLVNNQQLFHFNGADGITSLYFSSGATFNGGTVYIYGVK